MGKLRGFLEYDRIKEETIAPKERIGNYKEFTIAPKTRSFVKDNLKEVYFGGFPFEVFSYISMAFHGYKVHKLASFY